MTPTEQILSRKIVAIVRLTDYSRAVEVAQALLDGGITVLEFTLTGNGALEAITTVRKTLGDQLCVGVGSVLHPEQATSAIDAGAQFVVTPAMRPAAIAACVNRGVLVLSGGITPTELLAAHEAGAELVKLFPARLGGPAYMKDVLAPLPFLKLVPTGGVSADNARDYLAAGAVALGIGGNLIPQQAVSSGNFAQITAAARDCVAAVVGDRVTG
ncbi:MAG: bifunctional 4-hydroxy-2-oxoglutarate aldolase/2-dehydro-3-deoxy-phosphogluconate aldolase [Chloroflexaceae bacterium]|jgi:2-dehydro-3-deoxyphosphogluconate aldolase/(4S)-4-hydroxy-2-oxoglutarate aldolase|nr:bifunctional 4-hydroxy-2-oxoglutarate aldolase/2-dehydro-3-deoxy-phosphogluconate aldolase [Chloroflexaceae bacterium]